MFRRVYSDFTELLDLLSLLLVLINLVITVSSPLQPRDSHAKLHAACVVLVDVELRRHVCCEVHFVVGCVVTASTMSTLGATEQKNSWLCQVHLPHAG